MVEGLLDMCCGLAADVPGAVAEFGVYRGESAERIAANLPGRTLHLFDTFCGMPASEIRPVDGHKAGDFAECGDVRKRVPAAIIHAGLFRDTKAEADGERFAFVHLDADLYESTRQGLGFFWPRMNPGGVILLDDYNASACRGCTDAAHEWSAKHRIELRHIGKQRAWVIKPREESCQA